MSRVLDFTKQDPSFFRSVVQNLKSALALRMKSISPSMVLILIQFDQACSFFLEDTICPVWLVV